ncbi:MAG: energy transducer TonB [Bryobacteraceae bacterium]
MPDWMKALSLGGMLCLPLAPGVCQDTRQVPVHRAQRTSESSVAHYRLAESYLQEDNPQSAANEYRLAQRTGDNTNGALDEANKYMREATRARLGASDSAPVRLRSVEPIQKIEPEYTEEARLAELEGTVVLSGFIDEGGFARNLEVTEPIGLGLDEKAIEAVKQWAFAPNVNREPVQAAAQIEVRFRLPSKQSRWHLIGVQFRTPPGVSRPVFTSALYPIGAGIGPEAMEEGRVLVAIGRLATAKLTFDVDEHGVPTHFQTPLASEPVWGSEATALVGQWRFQPAMSNRIPVSVPCTVELIWGERELTDSTVEQWRSAMNVQ